MRYIRPVVLCVFHHEGRILVYEGHDPVERRRYCRPLGGGIEFGETSAQALAREVREELGAEITDLREIGTLENLFTRLGEPGHEIVRVYDAAFADPGLYKRPFLPGVESDGATFEALWRGRPHFSAAMPLLPNGLADLLESRALLGSPA